MSPSRSAGTGTAVTYSLPEPGAGHRPVEDLGGRQPVGPEGGGKRQRFVVPVWNRANGRLTPRGIPVQPIHCRVRGRLIETDTT